MEERFSRPTLNVARSSPCHSYNQSWDHESTSLLRVFSYFAIWSSPSDRRLSLQPEFLISTLESQFPAVLHFLTPQFFRAGKKCQSFAVIKSVTKTSSKSRLQAGMATSLFILQKQDYDDHHQLSSCKKSKQANPNQKLFFTSTLNASGSASQANRSSTDLSLKDEKLQLVVRWKFLDKTKS